ncbi:MAG: transcription elongation factor GreA [uncultured bacterium]|nr:MAG: transcription elongation factor GreA [uncultured bacterium]
MAIPDRFPMTRLGYDMMKQEFDHLKSVERPKIMDEVETARAHGDLSENAEYHAAREKMGHIQGRIMDLELRLSRAEIIDPVQFKGQDKVMFGAKVTLLDLETDKESIYQIVGEYEADVNVGKLSITSPIARAVVGKKTGETVIVRTPKGPRDVEIVAVEY